MASEGQHPREDLDQPESEGRAPGAGGSGDCEGAREPPGAPGETGGAAPPLPGARPGPSATGPEGEASEANATPPAPRLLHHTLRAPFRSSREAWLACEALAPETAPGGPVHVELQIFGSLVTVRLSSQNPRHLRLCALRCRDKLATTQQAFMCLPPRFAHKPTRREGR